MKKIRAMSVILLLCLGAASTAWAIWVEPGSVPVDRLLKNLQTYLNKHPNEAQAYYVLGRIHSLAFARGTRELPMYGEGTEKLPEVPAYEPIITRRATKGLTKDAQTHLLAAIRNYQKATALDAKHAKAFLGLAWVLEDGAGWADKVEPFPTAKKPNGKTAYWQAQALTAYRRAYQLSVARDLKLEGLGPGADDAISLEAGEGITRLLRGRKLSAAERKEVAEIERTKAELEKKPRAITPIIFPLTQASSLAALLQPETRVRFDLAGAGKAAWWPWIKPSTGILVWNPEQNGRITSGLQLFGSVTWWIAWPNGYEPLALLDDNGDGWLRGSELAGLAVWVDANSNGVSDAGEVRRVQMHGITGLAVRSMNRTDKTLFHPQGIQLRDGRFLPTYDWTPTEIKTIPFAFSP